MNIQKKQRRTFLCHVGLKPVCRPLSPARLCMLGMAVLLFSATGYGQISRDVASPSGAASSESSRALNAEERLAALEKELTDLRETLSAPVQEKMGEAEKVAETSPAPAVSQSTAVVESTSPVPVDGTVPKTTDAERGQSSQITPEKTPAGTPSLLPPPPSVIELARTEGIPEAVAPRTLSEQEQNSYVVGMMVADYARSVLGTLDKLDVRPDEKLFREGLQDSLSGRPVLDGPAAQAAMQRIQKSADARQAERDAEARKELATIAGVHTVLEKKEDRIWVRLKKGGPAVSKQTPLLLSWEGQFYNGAVFETVTDAEVSRREVLPSWLQQAIRLAGPGGQVRLFILAGSIEGEAPLPAGTGRHELVQYTVNVKKAK